MDLLALILSVAALVMFGFAASGRELRHFNEIALGLVFLTAALILGHDVLNSSLGISPAISRLAQRESPAS